MGSHAFLNLFGQPPGTPLSDFRQQSSSTNRQFHWRTWASVKSFTYRLRCPPSACSFMFKKNDPPGVSTAVMFLATSRNHSTYWSGGIGRKSLDSSYFLWLA